MEVTAHLFRTLASLPRMRILRLLAVLDECNVVSIADALGTRPYNVSAHLKILASAGLVWRRRSGRVVYYRLAENPASPLTRGCLELLRSIYARVRVRAPKRIASCSQGSSNVFADAAIFRDVTAFTHPRRLQLIRCLHNDGPSSVGVLARQLRMSLPACQRHIDKLERRGFLVMTKRGRTMACTLATDLDEVQTTLLGLVLERLTGHSQ